MKLLLPREVSVSQKQTSKSAKLLYRPVGLVCGLIGGVIAGQVRRQVWKRVSPPGRDEAPKALSTGYPVKEILISTVIQGRSTPS